MMEFLKKNILDLVILFFLFIAISVFIFSYNFSETANQQFSELARSFLNGKFYFLDGSLFNRPVIDNVFWNGHFYWPLGPLPAVVLAPFFWLAGLLGFYFYQGYLNFLFFLLIFWAVFKLARKIGFSAIESLYWSEAFVFGSMFLGVAMIGSSWYFAHAIAVLLLFAALLEYFGRKRYFLIGLFFGLVLLTRLTAFLGIIFVLLDILWQKDAWKVKARQLLALGAIPLLCLVLLASYNYARFQNPFEQGYRGQVLQAGFMVDKENFGLFSLEYLPRGIYYSLLAGPEPVIASETHRLAFPFLKANTWGMGLFFTSPYLLYLFFMKIRSRKAKLLLAASAAVWLAIASSFFIGFTQFGFRYALDFMPLLFTAFMLSYRDSRAGMGWVLKTVILLSAMLNLYFLLNA